MLKKELLLMCGGDRLYTITVGDGTFLYGFAGEGDIYTGNVFGSLTPKTFDGGTIELFAFYNTPFDAESSEVGGVTLNGVVCFTVCTSKTSSSHLKFTRMDTGGSITTADWKSVTVEGKSYLVWSSTGKANSGLFTSSDIGKTIKVKIEYV